MEKMDKNCAYLLQLKTQVFPRRGLAHSLSERRYAMGDKGSKDKGNKEQKKKPKHTLKEKKKLKKEKKNK